MSSPENSEDEAASMAALMGFSTFGSHKPPAKKRKFNANTDAFVEGQELAQLDRGGKKGADSGGNTVALGRMREFGSKSKVTANAMGTGGNRDEIALDLDDQDEGEGGAAIENVKGQKGYGRIQLPPPVHVEVRGRNGDEIPLGLDDEEDEGPRYEDTSLPAPADAGEEKGPEYLDTSEDAPTEAAAAEMEARRVAIFARNPPGASVGGRDDDAPLDDEDGHARTTTSYASTLPPPPYGLPPRPGFVNTEVMQGASRGSAFSDATSASTSSRGGRGRGRGGHGGTSRGEYNKMWYEGYYDPSFNENPWAKLEQEKGLPSVGTWLERPQGKYDSRREESKT